MTLHSLMMSQANFFLQFKSVVNKSAELKIVTQPKSNFRLTWAPKVGLGPPQLGVWGAAATSLDEPLTPNHLLLSRGSVNLPPGLFDKRDSYARRRWAQTQYLANEFWRRWVREFLPNITYRQKWQQRRRNLKLEEIVFIVDDSLPRFKWTIGRVVETFADKHGLVRIVNVKTSTTVLKRPISKLCLILNSDEV